MKQDTQSFEHYFRRANEFLNYASDRLRRAETEDWQTPLSHCLFAKMGKGGGGGGAAAADTSTEGIRVAVRVRPFLPHEAGSSSCVEVNGDANQISIGRSDRSTRHLLENSQGGGAASATAKPRKTFTFDHALAGNTPQNDVYDSCVSSLVASCLEGFNATTLAYGQTGAGKTYTILGPSAASAVGVEDEVSREVGIIPRALGELFGGLERSKKEVSAVSEGGVAEEGGDNAPSSSSPSFEYNVKLQFLELYGEDIRDLLAPTGKPGSKPTKLTIRDAKNDCEVLGATSVDVSSADDALLCLTRGMLKRVTAATAMNAESSRSHAIMTVLIEQVKSVDGEKTTIKSKFNFVDLAGSERAKRTGAAGQRLKEGIDINKGLLVLGNVISALATIDPSKSKTKFVPFRDSKLTRILRGSLGGDHKTLLFVCVSPSARNLEESLNALRYANRAKNIKNKATKHVSDSGSAKLIAELRGQVGSLAAELLRIRMGGDPEGGTPFTLASLELLAKGQSAQIGNTAQPKLAPPQDLETIKETDTTLENNTKSAVSGDNSDLQAALDGINSKLSVTEEKLAEMTKERDELKEKVEGNNTDDELPKRTEMGEEALVSIVERIVSYQRDMEEADMSSDEWSDQGDDDDSSITFDDENDDDELNRRGPKRKKEDVYALDVASGLYSTGLFLVESQSYEDSLPCFQVALEIRREQFGWDDAGVGDVLYMEGLVRACIRDHDRALILLYDALRIRKNLSDAKNVAATLRTIGDLHVSKKEYTLADMFYEECLHSAMECNDSSVTDIWLSLAKVKKKVRQNTEALDCVEEILAVWRDSYGSKEKQDWGFGQDGALRRNISPEEAMMAPTLYEIGVLAFQLNDGTRGNEALTEFINIREAQGTDINDVKVANASYTLGNHCSAKRDTDSAHKYWNRALKIYLFVGLPDDHPHIVQLKELTQSAPRNRLLSGFKNAISNLTTESGAPGERNGDSINVVSEMQDMKS